MTKSLSSFDVINLLCKQLKLDLHIIDPEAARDTMYWEKNAPLVFVSHMMNANSRLQLLNTMSDQQICHFQSSIGLCQIFIPHMEKPGCLLMAGPFLPEFLPINTLRFILQQNNILPTQQLYNYYLSLPILNEEQLDSFLQLANDRVFREQRQILKIDECFTASSLQGKLIKNYEEEKLHATMEVRYSLQMYYMQSLKEGDLKNCIKCYHDFADYTINLRLSTDSVQNERLSNHLLNSVSMTAVIEAGLPAYETDKLFTLFTQKIESSNSTEELNLVRLSLINEYCKLVQKWNADHYSPSVKKAVYFIHSNYQRPLTLEMVAKAASVSLSALTLRFKEEIHCSIGQYINDLRMRKAAELLLSTSYKISEISEMVGMHDQNYFSRQFRKKYDCTPSEYRSK
ncbi:MAG: helix-turn-helix transcriptional regulator [Clostridiales bacterium]|nr:helix-turn-helix transcriptional regulator [Clostridiales bacterium]